MDIDATVQIWFFCLFVFLERVTKILVLSDRELQCAFLMSFKTITRSTWGVYSQTGNRSSTAAFRPNIEMTGKRLFKM